MIFHDIYIYVYYTIHNLEYNIFYVVGLWWDLLGPNFGFKQCVDDVQVLTYHTHFFSSRLTQLEVPRRR